MLLLLKDGPKDDTFCQTTNTIVLYLLIQPIALNKAKWIDCQSTCSSLYIKNAHVCFMIPFDLCCLKILGLFTITISLRF